MSYILYKTWATRQSSGPRPGAGCVAAPPPRTVEQACRPCKSPFFNKKVLQARGVAARASSAGSSAAAKSRNRRRASGAPWRAGITAWMRAGAACQPGSMWIKSPRARAPVRTACTTTTRSARATCTGRWRGRTSCIRSSRWARRAWCRCRRAGMPGCMRRRGRWACASAHFILVTGPAIDESVIQRGPFVMADARAGAGHGGL